MSDRLVQDAAAREVARTAFDRPIVLRAAGPVRSRRYPACGQLRAGLGGPVSALEGPGAVAARALSRVVAITLPRRRRRRWPSG